jgi:hypothetical protein
MLGRHEGGAIGAMVSEKLQVPDQDVGRLIMPDDT